MYIYLTTTLLSCFMAYVFQRTQLTYSGILSISSNRLNHLILLAATIPLFLLSALRVGVGVDYWAYKQIYNEYTYSSSLNIEPGFKLIVSTLNTYSLNFQWLFIVSALITYLFIYKALKKSINPALSIFLFCNLSFLYYSLNTTRQFIAISIVLFSLQFIVKRKFLKYIATISIATILHMSAMLMIPMYFLLNVKYKTYQYALLLIISSISYAFRVSLINIILYFYPQYGLEGIFSYATSPSEIFIITSTLLILLIAYLNKRKLINRNDADIRIGINIAYFSFLIHTALSWVPLIDRASLYIDIGLIIFIPLFISKIPSKSSRFKIILFLIFYTSIYTFISVALNDSHSVMPYSSVLFESRF